MESKELEKLIKDGRSGDINAVEELIKRSMEFIWRVVVRMMPNKTDVDDVVEEVCMKIIKSLKDFKMDSKYETWLYRISVNTAIDFIRKEKRKEILISKDNAETYIEQNFRDDKELTPEVEDVKKAFDALNEEYKSILILHIIEQKDYEEISLITGKDINTLRVLLYRAKEKLKENYFKIGKAYEKK